jgi:DNA-directed RNA polymerase subunit omega
MARITSEQAVKAVGSKYDLVLIGARRARELSAGWAPLKPTRAGAVVTALQEIEAGLVGRDYLMKPPNVELDRNQRRGSRDRGINK